MARPRKYAALQVDEVCKVVREERGLLAPAAQRLGVNRTTLRAFILNRQNCAVALKEAREALGDLAEQRLFDLINAGDYRAITFYLTCLCKDRGYILPRRASPEPDDKDVEVVYQTVEEVRRELDRRGISLEVVQRIFSQPPEYIEHEQLEHIERE